MDSRAGRSMSIDVETLTGRYGREIFARVNRTGPFPLTPAWWDEQLMDWSMSDDAIKVQLFRFVDALPTLRSGSDITRHLREYFAEVPRGPGGDPRLPRWLTLGLRLLPSKGPLANLLAWIARFSARRLARTFIAGTNVREALDAIARMRQRNLAFTVDLLGEATITEEEAELSQAEYLELINGLSKVVNTWPANERIDSDPSGTLPRVNVSVKLSALYSQFDPIDPEGAGGAVKARLRPLLQAARRQKVFVNFDMEQFAFKDLTLRIFREILTESEFRDWTDVGVAVQAYLRDTTRDLAELRQWAEQRGTAVWVRLVKGAYWDYETIMGQQLGWPIPVWTHKWETDANYERQTRFLLENHRWLKPAFGSHNIRSLAHALAAAQVLDLPPRSFEIQMLYGMADPIKDALVDLGQRVRVYTPFGQLLPGMAYLVRRLLENTANESFLRASFKENVPIELLLRDPEEIGQENAMMSAAKHLPHNDLSMPPESSGFHEEPLTDFRRPDMQQAMQSALRELAGQLGRDYPPILNNQPVRPVDFLPSVNPSHKSQVVGRFGRATEEHARQALAAAKAAFPGWRDTDTSRRADYLFAAAKILQRRRFEMAGWQVLECGKPWREADADVAETIDYFNFYGQEMLRLAKPRLRNVPGEDNAYFYEPRGVAVVIAPWNFPLAILAGMTSAALVTGNTVVMKPAEQSAVVGAKLMEVFQEAGLPPGVVGYLPGVGEEIGPTLVNHPDVGLIAFTGSRGVGLMINQQASQTPSGQDHVKRVIAEMGGKNAVIIDEDADLDEAVHGVVWSAFGYAGQKCSACSRVLAPESLYDNFLKRLIAAADSLKVLPAEEPGCSLGPVIDEEAQQRILKTIEKGTSEARLAYAGRLQDLESEGFYVAPHIFADVAPTASLAQEEIFGPVLVVIKVRDLTHALEIANGTRYALTGGLYSRSPAHIARVKREFRVGNLYINRKITGALVDRQPFGGFKLSGIGSKAGGPDYLLQFVLPRTITENTLRRGFAPDSEDVAGR
jgi:RHH-type transcriptional regulator, proline utilization regulon repressor / proline dehydrogenase / delta 1-pyrroline-5-carboxylate dehydrogenase